jgi:hypothetical protein
MERVRGVNRKRGTKRKRGVKSKAKPVNRRTGYYWVQLTNGQNKRWRIMRWIESLQHWDTFSTILEKGRRDTIIQVDENRILRNKGEQ